MKKKYTLYCEIGGNDSDISESVLPHFPQDLLHHLSTKWEKEREKVWCNCSSDQSISIEIPGQLENQFIPCSSITSCTSNKPRKQSYFNTTLGKDSIFEMR